MIRAIKFFIIGTAILYYSSLSHAQQPYYFGPEKIIVKLDPLTKIQEQELPIDRNFFIRVYLQDKSEPDVTLLELKRNKNKDNGENCYGINGYIKTIPTHVYQLVAQKDYAELHSYDIFVLEPLKPNREYLLLTLKVPSSYQNEIEKLFKIIHRDKGKITDEAKKIIIAINADKCEKGVKPLLYESHVKLFYDQHLKKILETNDEKAFFSIMKKLPDMTVHDKTSNEKVVPFAQVTSTDMTTNSSNLETRTRSRVQPDFGLVFYGIGGKQSLGVSDKFNGVIPYVGINILVRPFDGNIKLSQLPKGHINFFHRLSANIGLTLSSLEKEGQTANFFKSFNPMLGVGVRLSSAIKFNSGIITYRVVDENPLVNDTDLALIGYAGISIDLRIRNVVGDVGKLLIGN